MSQEVPMDALRWLQSEIHYEFKQVKLLIRALTHTSYANEQDCVHNERLNFSEMRFWNLPCLMSCSQNFRKPRKGIADAFCLGQRTGFGGVARKNRAWVLPAAGQGEAAQGGREKNSVLSDALEAVLGAIYLDGGLEAVIQSVNFLYEGRWPAYHRDISARTSKANSRR